jgi:hypothetical protein
MGVTRRLGVWILLLIWLVAAGVAQEKQIVRWTAGQPECAFRADDDGVYRYALATRDFAITLAVDSQELDKARQRIEPVLGLFLSVRFPNQNSAGLTPAGITLEFVKHFHDKERPLDPEHLAVRLTADREAATARAATNLRKHPEQKNEIEAELDNQQRSIDQMIEFLHGEMLQGPPPGSNQTAGWLLFSTKNRWIGQLNQQEEFVLRIPLGTVVAEFPFTLPPTQGDIELRTRPE